ncbi:GyrI-like domain-containing protein [Sphingobacterium lactis]|uniref:GyrI-like domain-containing protein n=1 Tax=Sphingobacterium lactis TaxID=797291 RepID=UPI003EC515DC
MKHQIIESFHVIGISRLTTNVNGQSAKDIEALWVKFWTEKIQDQIPNQMSADFYAVYTDYESDYTVYYTTIIGSAVAHLDEIPEGFVGVTIPRTTYKKIISKGKMPEAIGKTWMEIWQDTTIKRTYKADFTVHGEKYFHGEEAEVETFLSVEE